MSISVHVPKFTLLDVLLRDMAELHRSVSRRSHVAREWVVNARSSSGEGRFRSYFDPALLSTSTFAGRRGVGDEPPGAVGGTYGSGCFHVCNNFSVSCRSACTDPIDRQHSMSRWQCHRNNAHLLLSVVRNVTIRFEERSYVERLASPQVPLDRPVKRELQGPAI